MTEMISSQLTLQRLNSGRHSRVVAAKVRVLENGEFALIDWLFLFSPPNLFFQTRLKRHLFRYQGYVSAALVLGGVDATGPHLHTVWPHGSTSYDFFVLALSRPQDDQTENGKHTKKHVKIRTLPYVTMGSGLCQSFYVFFVLERMLICVVQGVWFVFSISFWTVFSV